MPARKFGYDDDRPPPGPRRPIRIWSITRWLIVINVVVFFLDLILQGQFTAWGDFSIVMGIHHWQLWRWITFQFLHAGPYHLLVNMIGLYIFGPMIELRLDKPRFAIFYLLCGTAGAVAYVLLWRLGILVHSETASLVGASAGIFGMAAAAAVVNPHLTLRLLWPPISLKLRTMVLVFIGLALAVVFIQGDNAGGEAAHLGGALAGYILIKNPHWLRRLSPGQKRSRFWQPGDPAANFFRKDT